MPYRSMTEYIQTMFRRRVHEIMTELDITNNESLLRSRDQIINSLGITHHVSLNAFSEITSVANPNNGPMPLEFFDQLWNALSMDSQIKQEADKLNEFIPAVTQQTLKEPIPQQKPVLIPVQDPVSSPRESQLMAKLNIEQIPYHNNDPTKYVPGSSACLIFQAAKEQAKDDPSGVNFDSLAKLALSSGLGTLAPRRKKDTKSREPASQTTARNRLGTFAPSKSESTTPILATKGMSVK